MNWTEIAIAVIAVAGVLYQAYSNIYGKKSEANVDLAKLVDTRVAAHINYLEGQVAALRKRVDELEDHIRQNDLPLP